MCTDVYLKRLRAWDTIKVRKFTIHRVYTSDQGQDDVLILGHLGTVLSDGRKGDEHWTARIVSAIDTDGTRKISLYRIWTVSGRLRIWCLQTVLTGSVRNSSFNQTHEERAFLHAVSVVGLVEARHSHGICSHCICFDGWDSRYLNKVQTS